MGLILGELPAVLPQVQAELQGLCCLGSDGGQAPAKGLTVLQHPWSRILNIETEMKGNYHRVPEGLGGYGRPESRHGQTGGRLVGTGYKDRAV